MGTSMLRIAVDQLIHPQKTAVHTDTGTEYHDVPALLDQLHDAVVQGTEQVGGGGFGARLPLNPAAVDLAQLLDYQIAEAWAAVTGRVPGVQTPRMLVAEWSTAVLADTSIIVTTPEQTRRWDEARGRWVAAVIRTRAEYLPHELAQRWVTMIEDLLSPARTAEILAPCIQCGEEKIVRTVDGETVTSAALIFRRDKATGETLDARCLACGATWMPSQFEYLATAIGITLGRDDVPETPPSGPVWRGSVECADSRHAACRSLSCKCVCHLEEEAA